MRFGATRKQKHRANPLHVNMGLGPGVLLSAAQTHSTSVRNWWRLAQTSDAPICCSSLIFVINSHPRAWETTRPKTTRSRLLGPPPSTVFPQPQLPPPYNQSPRHVESHCYPGRLERPNQSRRPGNPGCQRDTLVTSPWTTNHGALQRAARLPYWGPCLSEPFTSQFPAYGGRDVEQPGSLITCRCAVCQQTDCHGHACNLG